VAFNLKQLAEDVGARLVGDPEIRIDSVSTLRNARKGSISFLSNIFYKPYLSSTQASAVILSEKLLKECPVAALVTENPYLAYAKIVRLLIPDPEPVQARIHASAVVDARAQIHESASVGPYCVIESGVRIGPRVVLGPSCIIGRDCHLSEECRLVARVTVCHDSIIGKRCLVHPGVVIGSDGFGLANEEGVWIKIEQLGRVIIGDDVEIGANTTIDRGALDDTVLEDGVKLDNQVQVGHNVHIGAHTAIAGCVGIAGSAYIGSHCMIGGAAGLAGHLKIADNVTITGYSRVNSSVREPGIYTSGTPLQPTRQWQKNTARIRHLDEMARRIAALEDKLKNK
jgi:UDP-3-O-[3-hydroxymyristoyl] glucosamine N-acyltransferase